MGLLGVVLVPHLTLAATMKVQPALPNCGVPAAAVPSLPDAASARIPASLVAQGKRDVIWAWMGSPTQRYSHDALGSAVHAASLHALVQVPGGPLRAASVELPPGRVIEDRTPRIADLDGDGQEEIIVVESDLQLGSSIAVYGIDQGAASGGIALVERARSPFIGLPHRWLNPVGVDDFVGDGHADIAAVITPHIGGVLTLYRYRPPALLPLATLGGVSNHRIGTTEQRLAAIVPSTGQRPAVIIPAMGLRDVRAVRLVAGKWVDVAAPARLPASVQRILPMLGGACIEMTDGNAVRLTLGE